MTAIKFIPGYSYQRPEEEWFCWKCGGKRLREFRFSCIRKCADCGSNTECHDGMMVAAGYNPTDPASNEAWEWYSHEDRARLFNGRTLKQDALRYHYGVDSSEELAEKRRVWQKLKPILDSADKRRSKCAKEVPEYRGQVTMRSVVDYVQKQSLIDDDIRRAILDACTVEELERYAPDVLKEFSADWLALANKYISSR